MAETHCSSNLSSGRAIARWHVSDQRSSSSGRTKNAPWILLLNVLSAGRSPSIVRSITASISGLYTSPTASNGLL